MEIKDRIKVFKQAEKEMQQVVKDYVQDNSIPMEKRWEVFTTSKLGEHDGTYHEPNGVDWSKNTLYDDFYMEKHSVITAAEFVEIAEDRGEEKNYNVNDIKEYFMSNFLWSFKFDW